MVFRYPIIHESPLKTWYFGDSIRIRKFHSTRPIFCTLSTLALRRTFYKDPHCVDCKWYAHKAGNIYGHMLSGNCSSIWRRNPDLYPGVCKKKNASMILEDLRSPSPVARCWITRSFCWTKCTSCSIPAATSGSCSSSGGSWRQRKAPWWWVSAAPWCWTSRRKDGSCWRFSKVLQRCSVMKARTKWDCRSNVETWVVT